MGWRMDFLKERLLIIASILGALVAVFHFLRDLGLLDGLLSLLENL